MNDFVQGQSSSVRASFSKSPTTPDKPASFKGSATGKIEPGKLCISDGIPVSLSVGDVFYIRTFGAGPFQIYGGATNSTVVAWNEGSDAGPTTPGDKTMASGSIGSGTSMVIPLAIFGDADPSITQYVGLYTESIGAGVGDTSTIVDAERGFLRRSMNNVIPYLHLGNFGDFAANTANLRIALMQGMSSVICALGINDVRTGSTLATLQAAWLNKWTLCGLFGSRVYQTTLTPITTSTDVWATAANQTPTAAETARVGGNDWLRAGAPIDPTTKAAVAIGTSGALLAGQAGHPLTGYFETADTVEVNAAGAPTRNGARWAVGSVYITDGLGLHPSSSGHAAMAAAINTGIL